MFSFTKMISGLFKYVIVILLLTEFSTANFEDTCNKLVMTGDRATLKQMFTDFKEIKNKVKQLETSIDKYSRKIHIENTNQRPLLDLRYDDLPKECETENVPKDCGEATDCTQSSGVYIIKVDQYSPEPFYVECDADAYEGGWLVIQRRQDGSENFHRSWYHYEEGFGDVDNEFFIGLKKLYALTNFEGPQELLIIMEDVNGVKAIARYDTFSIGNDKQDYKLKSLGKYSGTAGNSLSTHLGMKFTTKDRDNDLNSTINCANSYVGAWWYSKCYESNLNGKYNENIHWLAFRTSSLKYVKMMIRRSRTI